MANRFTNTVLDIAADITRLRASPCPRKHLRGTPCLCRPPALESSPPGRTALLETC